MMSSDPGEPRAVDPGLDDLARALRARRPEHGCYIIAVTGAVAAGKSTLAASLAALLRAWPDHPRVEAVATDGFLHPNAVLDKMGLTARKGFPESYDVSALRLALEQAREGRAAFPSYSHVTYDVDPRGARWIERPDILIIEGLSLNLDAGGDGVRVIDTLIYLDAEEADIEHWFVGRFLDLWVPRPRPTRSGRHGASGLGQGQPAKPARAYRRRPGHRRHRGAQTAGP
jgi:type I pantothenate kinase